jgi:hypothetical protein
MIIPEEFTPTLTRRDSGGDSTAPSHCLSSPLKGGCAISAKSHGIKRSRRLRGDTFQMLDEDRKPIKKPKAAPVKVPVKKACKVTTHPPPPQ